jgi:predicted nucleic acid-binding protein
LTPEHDRPTRLVLDTNIVLDLLVFADPAARPLAAAFALRKLEWLATAAMREELDGVLGYPQIMARLALASRAPADVLESFDRQARIVAAPARACVTIPTTRSSSIWPSVTAVPCCQRTAPC